MSPLLPIIPATVEPAGSTINRQFVIESNGGQTLRDGGGPAPAPDTRDLTSFHVFGFGLEFETDLSEGIDYALWTKTVSPARREGFADTLDFVDLLDD
jgi:hypothetical protein